MIKTCSFLLLNSFGILLFPLKFRMIGFSRNLEFRIVLLTFLVKHVDSWTQLLMSLGRGPKHFVFQYYHRIHKCHRHMTGWTFSDCDSALLGPQLEVSRALKHTLLLWITTLTTRSQAFHLGLHDTSTWLGTT